MGGGGATTGIPVVTACCALSSDTHNVTAAQYVLWAPTSPSQSLTTFLELLHGTKSNVSFTQKLGKCREVPGWGAVQKVPST